MRPTQTAHTTSVAATHQHSSYAENPYQSFRLTRDSSSVSGARPALGPRSRRQEFEKHDSRRPDGHEDSVQRISPAPDVKSANETTISDPAARPKLPPSKRQSFRATAREPPIPPGNHMVREIKRVFK